MQRLGLLAALSICSVNLLDAQLSTKAAFNPFSGQGAPPEGYSPNEYPVSMYVGVTNLVNVAESDYTFTANFYLLLYYQDSRTLPILMSNYSRCDYYCASRMSTLLNEAGEPACCDGVYIPQAHALNGVASLVQTYPYRYGVYPYRNNTVVYYTQLQASYSASMDYTSYPFDSHYLNIDLLTTFLPVLPATTLSGAGFSVSDGVLVKSQLEDTGDPAFQPGAYRPSITDSNCAGWVLRETWLDVMNWTIYGSETAHQFGDLGKPVIIKPGVRIYLKVARANKSFHVVILILPTVLITLFSFVIFFFPMSSQKARIQLIVTLFITLIILQFTLQQFLPGTYTMIGPVYLVLVSYIYTFITLLISVSSPILLRQYHRRSQKIIRQDTRKGFSTFRAAILAGQRRGMTKQDVRHMGQQRIRHIIAVQDPHGSQQRSANGDAHQGAKSNTVIGELDSKPEREMRRRPESVNTRRERTHCNELQDADGDEEDAWMWYEEKMRHWYFRNITPVRLLILWYKFIGQSTSKWYLEFVCHHFETWSMRILFLAYLLAVGLIFGLAASKDDPGRVRDTELVA